MPSNVCMKFFVERQRWRHAARENRKARKMAFRRTQYYDIFRKKAVTVHVENVTIEWLKDDDVIKIYFPKSTHPEFGKIGNEFHFWTSKVSSWTSRTNFGASKINYWASKTKVVIIPDVTSEDDTPQLQKANNGQTVYTLHIGISTRDTVSFTLKVNDFTARFNPFTMSADGLNWLFDYEYEECDDEATVIVMPYSTRIQLIHLREGDVIVFPGADGIAYEVGVVSFHRYEGWRIKVMVDEYENGSPTYRNYSVFGHPNSWFVPSTPPRSQL